MKKIIIITTFFLTCIAYSQQHYVSKTEVLVDAQKNQWSMTTENVFVESINFIPGGSLELTLPNKQTVLIYKLEITTKIDKDGNNVLKFSLPLIRGSDSEIEITMINNKPAFAYGNSKGWQISEPNKLVIFRLWF